MPSIEQKKLSLENIFRQDQMYSFIWKVFLIDLMSKN